MFVDDERSAVFFTPDSTIAGLRHLGTPGGAGFTIAQVAWSDAEGLGHTAGEVACLRPAAAEVESDRRIRLSFVRVRGTGSAPIAPTNVVTHVQCLD